MPKIVYKDKNYSMGIGKEIEIDNILNETSENPVQNKVVTNALNEKLNISDISDWAKADSKPTYTASEVGADTQGSANSALNSAKEYTDTKISDLINSAPETLDTLKEIADAIEENETVVEVLNTAVGAKANATDLATHTNNTSNPHNVTKAQVGLGNVENKSSETIRGELTKTDVTNALGYTPPTTDTKYTLPTATASALGGIKSGGDITVGNDGTVIVNSVNGKTVGKDVPTDAKFTDTVYTLPVASTTTLGGVKVDGETITIDDNGIISVTGSGNGGGIDLPSAILNDCTPEQIQAAARNGTAANYWSIGDKIGITLNGVVGQCTFSNETYYAVILGFNHNSNIEGNNSIHFQFGKNESGIDIAFCDDMYHRGNSIGFIMNTTETNKYGWDYSYMRQVICPAFFTAMPTEWQAVISDCMKYSDNIGDNTDTASYVTSTSDKIWLLSEFEVYGKRTYANSAEKNYQKQYDYYRNGNSKIKYKHLDESTTCFWWLRSPQIITKVGFCNALENGVISATTAYQSLGFVPCFKVD